MQTKNYLLEEIKQNEMISKNQKKTCATFDYLEKLLILTKYISCTCKCKFKSKVGQ